MKATWKAIKKITLEDWEGELELVLHSSTADLKQINSFFVNVGTALASAINPESPESRVWSNPQSQSTPNDPLAILRVDVVEVKELIDN